jgi:hypothetical protein
MDRVKPDFSAGLIEQEFMGELDMTEPPIDPAE